MQTSDFHIRDLTVSPDGKQLLYETDFQIYVTDARPGAEPRAVASGVAPRWSPDGRSISYLVDRRSKIRILPLNGGDERTVDITPSSWPEASTSGWSADGKSLAVVTGDRDRSSLVVVTADGTRRTLVENSELKSSAIWSSDGKTIFYAENHPATVGYYISTEPVTDLAAKAASRRDHLPDPAEVIVRESSAAPPFALNDLNGDPVRLASIDAPFTVLYFWSTSRECESDLQALSQLNERFASQGVAVLSLSYSSGTPEQIRRFLDTLDVNLPTLMCSKRVCDDYGVAVFPTTFVLDRNHRIRDWKYGVQIDEHWQQLFDSMLASD